MNYIEMAQDIAKEYGVDPDIFVRLIQQESRFDPDAVSEKGAAGLPSLPPPSFITAPSSSPPSPSTSSSMTLPRAV